MDIDNLLVCQQPNLMEVGKLLDKLIDSNTHIEYVFQHPGQLVSSPPGNGSAHLVISNGIFMTQLAWNLSYTMTGAIECLSFWGEQSSDRDFGHLSFDNGSQATRTVIPLFTMEEAGYNLSLADKLHWYLTMIERLKTQMSIVIEKQPINNSVRCKQCLYRQDWIRINNQCIHCFFKDSHILKLLQ